MSKIISLLCGIIFGIGLTVSQMIDPAKILGFLKIFGYWDPSLIFVIVGALIISSPFFHLFKDNKKKTYLVANINKLKKIYKKNLVKSLDKMIF